MRHLVRVLAVTLILAAGIAIFATARADKPMSPTIKPNPAAWPNDRITVSNLGHACLLMNYLGVRAITDPSLFDRVGLAVDSMFTIGPKRISAPPLTPGE